jgi:hypothetical protein
MSIKDQLPGLRGKYFRGLGWIFPGSMWQRLTQLCASFQSPSPERAPRKRRVEEMLSPVQEKRRMRELPVMPNHKLACNIAVFANERGDDGAELDSWIRLSDVRPGAMGLAANIKALLEGFVELPDFLHVINQRNFLEKGLPPSWENLQRMVGFASALKPGSVAIWTGKYTARLFQSCFQHGHPEFHSNQPIRVMQDMLDAEAASVLALSELQRQMYVWPLDKFKVIICRGVLHIGTVGHLARKDNPVLPHIQLAMPNIFSRFQHFQRLMKMQPHLPLQKGMAVRLFGLEARQDLNGQVGTLLDFNAEQMRWNVILSTQQALVKPANIACNVGYA